MALIVVMMMLQGDIGVDLGDDDITGSLGVSSSDDDVTGYCRC